MRNLIAALLWSPIVVAALLVCSIFLWAAFVQVLMIVQPDDFATLLSITLRAAARMGQ